MTSAEAAAILGVSLDNLTENDLRVAFSRAVKLAHPDTGGSGHSNENIAKAKRARDVLLNYTNAGALIDTCKPCRGKGSVPSGFGAVTCKSCKGTGKA